MYIVFMLQGYWRDSHKKRSGDGTVGCLLRGFVTILKNTNHIIAGHGGYLQGFS